jgi:hypothetical protein
MHPDYLNMPHSAKIWPQNGLRSPEHFFGHTWLIIPICLFLSFSEDFIYINHIIFAIQCQCNQNRVDIKVGKRHSFPSASIIHIVTAHRIARLLFNNTWVRQINRLKSRPLSRIINKDKIGQRKMNDHWECLLIKNLTKFFFVNFYQVNHKRNVTNWLYKKQ